MEIPTGVLFGYGNPLLDISAEVTLDFINSYGLKTDDQILASENHQNLYEDLIKKFKVNYIPGGATQNTIRVAQWMLAVRNATTFTGCIGRDKYGEILETIITKEGVQPAYKYIDDVPTGTCAVLITDTHRSLVANLAAANKFDVTHLRDKLEEYIEEAKYFYSAGYPITASPDSMLYLAKYAAKNNKVYSMNLSAPFICQFFKDTLLQLLPYVDVLFANEAEALAFSEANDLQVQDMKQIALKLQNWPKENNLRKRIVIITQGHLPTVVCHDCKITEHPVMLIDKSDIVDTNGAGDSFVGGFLAHLIKACKLECCIKAGQYAANYIIQQNGVQLPTAPTYKCTCKGGSQAASYRPCFSC